MAEAFADVVAVFAVVVRQLQREVRLFRPVAEERVAVLVLRNVAESEQLQPVKTASGLDYIFLDTVGPLIIDFCKH